MTWDYAVLSQMAKEAGGPEELLKLIEEGGRSKGRTEGRISMLPWMGLAVLGTAGVIKLVDHFKAKKAISQAALDEAKAELIRGIEDYNAAHPDVHAQSEAENNSHHSSPGTTEK